MIYLRFLFAFPIRSNYGLNLAKWTSSSQSRSFCTPLSQKPTENSPPPIDADTKQLISQIEDLNKSVEELSNEKAELLVSLLCAWMKFQNEPIIALRTILYINLNQGNLE